MHKLAELNAEGFYIGADHVIRLGTYKVVQIHPDRLRALLGDED
jgi:hypothetical protein